MIKLSSSQQISVATHYTHYTQLLAALGSACKKILGLECAPT